MVSRLGQNRQSLDENESEQLQKTIELSLEQRSSEIPSFTVSCQKLSSKIVINVSRVNWNSKVGQSVSHSVSDKVTY